MATAREIKVDGTIFYQTADGFWRHKYLSKRGAMTLAKVSKRQQARIDAALDATAQEQAFCAECGRRAQIRLTAWEGPELCLACAGYDQDDLDYAGRYGL